MVPSAWRINPGHRSRKAAWRQGGRPCKTRGRASIVPGVNPGGRTESGPLSGEIPGSGPRPLPGDDARAWAARLMTFPPSPVLLIIISNTRRPVCVGAPRRKAPASSSSAHPFFVICVSVLRAGPQPLPQNPVMARPAVCSAFFPVAPVSAGTPFGTAPRRSIPPESRLPVHANFFVGL